MMTFIVVFTNAKGKMRTHVDPEHLNLGQMAAIIADIVSRTAKAFGVPESTLRAIVNKEPSDA